mgnify:CR=1 FL=1
MIQTLSDLKTVRFNEQADGVIILDQTLLPGKEAYLTLTTAEEIWDAIYKLKVRGAPAIGIAAAYGVYVCARRIDTAEKSVFVNEFRKIKEYLAGSRPTAVNLVAALNRMERVLVAHPTLSVPEWKELLYKEAIARKTPPLAGRSARTVWSYSVPGWESLRIATPDIWRSRSMAPPWRRFIWGRREAMVSRSSPTRPVLCCKAPGSRPMS